ncbi:MAG: hypothetical protein SNH99_01840 [Rikenellaceae bacterium]
MESTNQTNDVVKSFADCIQSHEDKIIKLNSRLNTPSTLEQLINAKNVMLKNKSTLHLNNRLAYPQFALDIIQGEFNELHKKYDDVIMRINHLIETAQYIQPTPQNQPQLPQELTSTKATELIDKAIKVGLIEKKGDSYKWNYSKALLAYFADKASEYLCLGKGMYDGKIKVSWKPFEMMFGYNDLSGAKRDYQREGTSPTNKDIVDSLF